MIVARAKTPQHHAPLVRAPVAVGVLEEQQLGAVTDVAAALHHFESGRNHQAVGEHRRLVRASVVIRVFEDEHLVVGLLARLDLRIDRAADDPEPPTCIEADLNRLHHAVRFAGEEVDLEAVGELEGGKFGFRGIGLR